MRIKRVKVNGRIFYQVKGFVSLHSTRAKAKRQIKGMKHVK